LFNIGYGLYVVTSNDGKKDNGLIVNTVTQVTDMPNRIAVTINKENYSHHVIKQTQIMNVNCLTQDAPFKVFDWILSALSRLVSSMSTYSLASLVRLALLSFF
jgi:flavin reductase (DIM6/NTAB) family NADH-FMN oxidoreductase RutF